MASSAGVTQGAGRGVLKQPIAIGIQPSMIAAKAHSPIVFGIIFSKPSLKQPAGASRLWTGLRTSA